MKKLLGECEIYVNRRGDQYKSTSIIKHGENFCTEERRYKIERRLIKTNKMLHRIDDYYRFLNLDGYNSVIE